ncbi:MULTISPECIES: hypothetical protein [Olivibacter]|uniref:Uncharacterized protein n=2 Tax=Sphingobacteriaceae TaxID=84566 RepID=F4CBV9_SPHS2|nr:MULTISPECIES: hypothetical protein [Olivibacter]MCL4638969.1 hypothetical protein [Olivibacter sp. UJ_SKK_5.1]MDM8173562.1 hypothetical protein [Olivibacter sp. 47]QEL03278.1 hypothetical protein FKG96_21440 [Olivibacter sp. LS-1]
MYIFVTMLQGLKALYIVIRNGEAICFETNLRAFVRKFEEIEGESRNFDFFYRKFKRERLFKLTLSGKEYTFQKLL